MRSVIRRKWHELTRPPIVATKRTPNRATQRRLPLRGQIDVSLERADRITGDSEAPGHILHVWLQAHRLGPQRQRVQHRHIVVRTMVGLEDICRRRFQDVYLADHLHPTARQWCHLHG